MLVVSQPLVSPAILGPLKQSPPSLTAALQCFVGFLQNLRTTLEMIKWEHSIFALPFALCGAMLAAGGLPAVASTWMDHPSDGFGALRSNGVQSSCRCFL